MHSQIALLDARTSPTPLHAHPAVRDQVACIDVYDLPAADLGRFDGLLVGGMVDQEFLYAQRDVVRAFCDAGKVVVFNGHLLRRWLPGGSPFAPTTIRSFGDYTVHLVGAHPLFDGVDARDLTLRRGVAGFYARGHHPPPDGAEVLATLDGGDPVTYVDRVSTRGTILVHAGVELLGYAGVDSTAARLAPQLLAWMRAEAARLGERRVARAARP